MLEIGQCKVGILASDCKLGEPLFFTKSDDVIHMTSNVFCVSEDEIPQIETESSVYSIRIVTDDNDEEFKNHY